MGNESQTCGNCGFYLKNILKFIVSQFGLVSLVVGYTIIGALLFEKLECDEEKQVKRKMTTTRLLVTDELWEMSQNSDILREEEWSQKARNTLKAFEDELITAIKEKGWDGKEGEEDLRWTFSGALFYSIILITTIGYGHIAPKTNMGKVMTIFYAIPGVPLMMLCLANVGDGMAHSFRFLYWKVCCYACTKRPKMRKSRRPTPVVRNSRYPSVQSGHRSRMSSFRKSTRNSQRSNDSQLSDPEFFGYSDPSYKIYDHDLGDGGNIRSATLPERGKRGRHDDRKQKDETNMLNKSVPNMRSSQKSNQNLAVPDSNSNETKGSVLFNKYALEKDDKTKHSSRRSSPNVMSDRHNDNEPNNKRDIDNGREKTPKEKEHESRESDKFRDRERQISRDKARTVSRERGRDTESLVPISIRRDDSPLSPSYRDSGYYSRPGHSRRSQMRNYEAKEFYYEDEYSDYEDEEEELEILENSEKPVPIWLGIMLVVLYIIAGAILFNHWEEWSFLNSVYFCFITLTTIGFGDFVPAQNTKKGKSVELSIALCSLYLLFGIALLAMSFNLVQEEVISNVKTVAKRLGIIKEEEEEE